MMQPIPAADKAEDTANVVLGPLSDDKGTQPSVVKPLSAADKA